MKYIFALFCERWTKKKKKVQTISQQRLFFLITNIINKYTDDEFGSITKGMLLFSPKSKRKRRFGKVCGRYRGTSVSNRPV